MSYDCIRYMRGFIRIPWWFSWCNTIIQEKSIRRWIFENNTNVTDFITTTKIMVAEATIWWNLWIICSSTWCVHDHTTTNKSSRMNFGSHPYVSIGIIFQSILRSNHIKLPLTIYTTRDKIRLAVVDFEFTFALLILFTITNIFQW